MIIEASPPRRLLSSVVDIGVSAAPSLYAMWQTHGTIDFWTSFSITYTFVVVLSTLISGYGTLGDVLLKIKTVHIDGKPTSRARLVSRNASYVVYMIQLIALRNEKWDVLLSVATLLLSSALMFSTRNQHKKKMSALDIVFKTIFVMRHTIDPEKLLPGSY